MTQTRSDMLRTTSLCNVDVLKACVLRTALNDVRAKTRADVSLGKEKTGGNERSAQSDKNNVEIRQEISDLQRLDRRYSDFSI